MHSRFSIDYSPAFDLKQWVIGIRCALIAYADSIGSEFRYNLILAEEQPLGPYSGLVWSAMGLASHFYGYGLAELASIFEKSERLLGSIRHDDSHELKFFIAESFASLCHKHINSASNWFLVSRQILQTARWCARTSSDQGAALRSSTTIHSQLNYHVGVRPSTGSGSGDRGENGHGRSSRRRYPDRVSRRRRSDRSSRHANRRGGHHI